MGKQIGQLGTADELDGSELIHTVQGGNSVQTTVFALANLGLAFDTKSASHTLVAQDRGKFILMDVATANTLTVPADSLLTWAVGALVHVAQLGAGTTTIVAGAGVTIVNADTLVLRHQGSVATLAKMGPDLWLLFGDLAQPS